MYKYITLVNIESYSNKARWCILNGRFIILVLSIVVSLFNCTAIGNNST